MKAKELRFGNRILLDGKEVEIDITQMCNFLFWEKNEQDFYPKRWEPIPLTEEWLLKFGICYDKNEKLTFLHKYSFYITNEHEEEWDIYENVNNSYVCSVHYVHQLQNLYFALCGEELKLKEI